MRTISALIAGVIVIQSAAPAGGPDWDSAPGSFLSTGLISAGQTSWSPTTTSELTESNVGICVIAKDETGTGTTDGPGNNQFGVVTDAAGNAWGKALEWCEMGTSTASNAACVAIYYTMVGYTLASGSTITFNFLAATAKAVTCWEFTPTAYAMSVTGGATGAAATATDPAPLYVATGAPARWHLFVRATGCENFYTGWTPTSGWVPFDTANSFVNGGTGPLSMFAFAEYRIANEADSLTSDPTYVNVDCASAIVGFNVD